MPMQHDNDGLTNYFVLPKNAAMAPKFITTEQAARRIGTTARYVQMLCKEGKVKGAKKFGGAWMVPASFKWEPQKPGPKPTK
jgi:hypothetical protein